MYYDQITKAEAVVFTASGAPQCGDSHYGSGYYRRDVVRPDATSAWYDVRYGGGSLSFTCKRHSGTVKAGITKGSWSFRDVVNVADFGFDVAQAAADPEGVISYITEAIKRRKAAAEQAAAERDLAYRREHWDEERGEHYADLDKVEFQPFGEPDEYGRVFVNLRIGSSRRYGSGTHLALTPAQVRKIVEFAGRWADNAERLTAEQVKP